MLAKRLGAAARGAGLAALCICLGSFAGRAPCSPVERDEPSDFAAAVPAGALFYLGIDDVPALVEDFHATRWGQFLADPACAAMVEFYRDRIRNIGKEVEAAAGTDPFDFLSMLSGRAAFVVHADDHGEERALGLLLDIRGSGDAWLEKLANLNHEAVERGELAVHHETHGNLDVTVLAPVGNEVRDRVRYAVAGEVFVLASQPQRAAETGLFERLVDGLGSSSSDSLAESEPYRSAVQDTARVRAGRGVRLYLDLQRALGAFGRSAATTRESPAGAEEASVASAFGCLLASARLTEQGIRGQLFGTWDGKGQIPGVVRSWFPARTPSLLRLVPAQAVSAMACVLDLEAGLDRTEALLRAAGRLEEGQDLVRETLGFSGRAALLPALDGEMAFCVAPVPSTEAVPGMGDEPLGVALVLGVKDAAVLRAQVEQLLSATGLLAARRRQEFPDHEVNSVTVFPFHVHYAILDDVAVVSLSATLLADILQLRSDVEPSSLAAARTLEGALAAVGEGTSLVFYSRQAPSVRSIMQAAAALVRADLGDLAELDTAELAGFGSPSEWMPPAELIEKYFDGAQIWTFETGEAGFSVHIVDS